MAIMNKSDQLRYTGKGPLDAKSLIKTYAELLSINTWTATVNGTDTFVAYNGMIVAVWLNKEDTSKNGIYFLYDPAVTSAVKKPDVENAANWHKLTEFSDIADFEARLLALEEKESDVITYGYHEGFPVEGEEGKLYVAADEKKSYVWFNGEYLAVSGSDSDSYEEPDVIYGGSAD
jgi:hypothetical protein